MPALELDRARADAFAERMVNTLNDGFLAMMLSIGHQTGLLATMGDMAPAGSDEIARAAGLDARNVREWLDALVAGRIVEYDPEGRTYHLPPEHAVSLTDRSGAANMAPFMLWVSCMGEVEPKLVEAFRHGRGVPYSAYARFHGIMNESSGQRFDDTLLQRALPALPGLVEWLEQGIDVLDVGCGSGHAINLMARAFPKSRFRGYDFSPEGIAAGQAEAKEWGLANAQFQVQDAAEIPDREAFDLITSFDAIHDQAHPRRVLAHIARALRPGGVYLMVEPKAASRVEENLGEPLAPFLYSISAMHCMQVSLAYEGEGVGAAWGEAKAREFLREAGFGEAEARLVQGDPVNTYYLARVRA